MPQKKNPDAAELLRAKAPRVAGPPDHPPRRAPRPAAHLQQGPPGGQGAALRRDRHRRAVPGGGRRRCSPAIAFDRERLAAAAADEFLAATDVADLLVKRGVPFREAHGIVGGRGARRGGAGQAAVRAHRGGAGRAGARAGRPELLRAAARRRLAGVEGLRGRHLAAARPRAARPGAPRPGEPSDARRRSTPRSTTGPVLEVARDLVGLRRCATATPAGRIVETEAYHETEPACHASRGLTPRTRGAVRAARAAPTSTAPTASTRC